MENDKLKRLQEETKKKYKGEPGVHGEDSSVKIVEEDSLLKSMPKDKVCTIETYDNFSVIAHKIFNYFAVNQSTTIVGWFDTGESFEKLGDMVLDEIRVLDKAENVVRNRANGSRRKRKLLPNSIGGYVAHKIFRYKYETINSKPHITIWRVQ